LKIKDNPSNSRPVWGRFHVAHVANIRIVFQWPSTAPGGSMQHERDMLRAKSKFHIPEIDHFVMAITAAKVMV
jgi:hypothetical protein